MPGSRKKSPHRLKFNWQLALVLLLAAGVLGGTLFALHKWRRRYLAAGALDRGLAAYEAKEWVTAAQELGRYCAVHRSDVEAWLKYADAQLHVQPQHRGNVEQAVGAYRQVLRLEETNREASMRASRIYVQVGMPAEAEMILTRYLGQGDDPAGGGRELLAMALAGQRKFRDAAGEVRKVIEAHPEEVGAYVILAQLMRERPEEVPGSPLEQLGTAVEKNPGSAEAHIALGTYLMRWGATAQAREGGVRQLEKARECDLSSAAMRVTLAGRLMDAGKLAEAEEELERADEQDPASLSLWLTWARLARAKESPEEAEEVARRGLAALGKEDYLFLAPAAELFLYARNDGEAEACLAKIKEVDPKAASITVLEGLIALARGEAAKAARSLREAAQQPGAAPTVRLALARAYEGIGDREGAIRELRGTVESWPNVPAARIALAKALGNARAWEEALEHSREAVRLEPENRDAVTTDLYVRANLALRAGEEGKERFGGIAGEIRKLRERYPDDMRLALLEVQVAGARGDVKQAGELARALQGSPEAKLQAELLEVSVRWKKGEKEKAFARMGEILSEHPGEPGAVLQLAEMLVQEKKPDEAEAVIAKGIEAVPQSRGDARRDLEVTLARFLAQRGERGKARERLRAVIRGRPDDLQARIALLGLFDSPDDPEAQKTVEEVKRIEGGEGPRWRREQARLWLASKDWEKHTSKIVELLKANVQKDGRDVESLLLLGAAHEKGGRGRLAIEAYRQAYERDGSSGQALVRLVSALQRANELDEAEQLLGEAGGRGEGGALSGLVLGQQLRQGRLEDASATLEEMIAQEPGNAGLRIVLASLKMRQDKLDEARAILGKLDEKEPAVLMTKAQLLFREGKTEEGLAACDKLVGVPRSFRGGGRGAGAPLPGAGASGGGETRRGAAGLRGGHEAGARQGAELDHALGLPGGEKRPHWGDDGDREGAAGGAECAGGGDPGGGALFHERGRGRAPEGA
ncbi:MAG: tetratricopeptide repeat protein [Planctomycetota bacterium]